jgi:hypothetical protein
MWKIRNLKGPGENESSDDDTIILSKELRPRLVIASFGLIAGLISSLAISGLILLVEKVTAVPVGTFYLILMAAITQSQLYSVNMIVAGLLLHLASGCIIGLVMAIPFATCRKTSIDYLHQYAPIYGLLFGFAIWSILFLPITFGIVLPVLGLLEDQTILQQAPTGPIASIDTGKLSEISNKIIFGALPFNMFYGLLVAIIIKLLSESYLYRKEPFKNIYYNTTSSKTRD